MGDMTAKKKSLIIVVVFATLVAGIQFWWIATFRGMGNLNGDEARYMAWAFHVRAMLFGNGMPEAPWFGPVVPALSAVLTMIGSPTVTTVMLVQPLMLILLAVSTWGVTCHVSTVETATITGVLLVLLPGVVAATQTYLLVLGAAAFLMTALWVLLASQYGENDLIWLFGVALSLTVLTRGQSLVFMPVVAGAAVLYCWRSKAGLRRLGLSLVVGGTLTLGYLIINRRMLQYLIGGYDMPISPTIGSRLRFRYRDLVSGLGSGPAAILVVGAVLGIVWSIAIAAQQRTNPVDTPSTKNHMDRTDALICLSIVGFGGLLSMVVSPNQGEYGMFDVPILASILVVSVSLFAVFPRGLRYSAYTVIAALLGVMFGRAVSVLPRGEPSWATRTGTYEISLMEASNARDPRFAGPRPASVRQANMEWMEFAFDLDSVLRDLDARSPDGLEIIYDSGAVNYNMYQGELVAAILGEPLLDVRSFPIREAGPSELPDVLNPDDPRKLRVLLIPRINPNGFGGPHVRTRDDLERDLNEDAYLAANRLYDTALAASWVIQDRLPLPLGDEMLIMVAPGAVL
ncbi:MAG: hypothetical protein R2735_08915 [Microthrixaceae bacterium]